MMGSRIHTYIRYAPLLLLCAFPHHVLLVGSMDCVTGIVIASYAIIAVPMGNMAACGEPRCNRVLNAAVPTFAVVFLVAISWFPGVREFAFFVLFVILCFDRLACLCSSGESMAVRDEAFDAVSYLRTDRFLPFFMLGIVFGVSIQAVLHVDGVLGTDVMLALPLVLDISACCLQLHRLPCPKRWCAAFLGVGLLMVAAGYAPLCSARLGLAYALLMLWMVVERSRGASSWRASVHALMFGIAAGVTVGLVEYEVRLVALRALEELQGALPASFDIEFRALIIVGSLLACSSYALYEFWTCPLYDAHPMPKGEFERIADYCAARGATDLQGLVVAYIALGESGRRIAHAVGYSVGSVNSARLAAYRRFGVHNRTELLQLLGRELGIAARPLRS